MPDAERWKTVDGVWVSGNDPVWVIDETRSIVKTSAQWALIRPAAFSTLALARAEVERNDIDRELENRRATRASRQ